MSFSVALPLIAVWLIGFPAFIFFKLNSNKGMFNDKDFLMKYGLFFIGLSDEAFYWEVVVQNSRKLLFIILTTFLPNSGLNLKVIEIVFLMNCLGFDVDCGPLHAGSDSHESVTLH